MKINKKHGFIALFSVIIISAVLLIAAISVNFSEFYGRFNILNSEFKEMSNKLVDACLEKARLSIALNEYNDGEIITVDVDSYSCEYIISSEGSIIQVASNVRNVCTYYYVEVNPNDEMISVEFFEERTEDTDLEMCD